MELWVLDEVQWGLAGSYLPLPQINLYPGGLLLSCYSILLLGISHRRKRIVIETRVREEISFCAISMVQGERGGSSRHQFRADNISGCQIALTKA